MRVMEENGHGLGDGVGRGFAGVEVGRGEVVHGELGSDMDSVEASVVGFFGGVVVVVGSDWWVWWLLLALIGLMVSVCVAQLMV